MNERLGNEQLEDLYAYIDGLDPPLSRPPRNFARDFADAVLAAEIVKKEFPRSVELHNYPESNNLKEKVENWDTLNRKVLRKMKFQISQSEIQGLVNAKPGVAEAIIYKLYQKMKSLKTKSPLKQTLGATINRVPEPAASIKNQSSFLAATQNYAKYDVNGKMVNAIKKKALTSPETVEELMQMEKYHRLLIQKLQAEASHDYNQYAEAVSALEGFEDWVQKYRTHAREANYVQSLSTSKAKPLGNRDEFQVSARRGTYFTSKMEQYAESPSYLEYQEKKRRAQEEMDIQRAEEEERAERRKLAQSSRFQIPVQSFSGSRSQRSSLSQEEQGDIFNTRGGEEEEEEEELEKAHKSKAHKSKSEASLTSSVRKMSSLGAEEDAADWDEHDDASTGKKYYVHKRTGEVRWLKPGEEWVECVDANTKKVYYFNRLTKTTSWVRPQSYLKPEVSGVSSAGASSAKRKPPATAPAPSPASYSSAGAGAGAATVATRSSRAPSASTPSFDEGDFVYLNNARFDARKETPECPRHWVAKVLTFVPPGQYRLTWMRETEVGSGLYVPKPKVTFVEAAVILKRTTKLVLEDEAKQMFRWASRDKDMQGVHSTATLALGQVAKQEEGGEMEAEEEEEEEEEEKEEEAPKKPTVAAPPPGPPPAKAAAAPGAPPPGPPPVGVPRTFSTGGPPPVPPPAKAAAAPGAPPPGPPPVGVPRTFSTGGPPPVPPPAKAAAAPGAPPPGPPPAKVGGPPPGAPPPGPPPVGVPRTFSTGGPPPVPPPAKAAAAPGAPPPGPPPAKVGGPPPGGPPGGPPPGRAPGAPPPGPPPS